MSSSARRTFWVVGAVALVIFTVLILGSWKGTCLDYVDAPGVCFSEPAVGGPQSVVLTAMALSGIIACVTMAVRARDPHDDDH